MSQSNSIREPCTSQDGAAPLAAPRRRPSYRYATYNPSGDSAPTVQPPAAAHTAPPSPSLYSSPTLSVSPHLFDSTSAGAALRDHVAVNANADADKGLSYFSTLPPDSPLELDVDHFAPTSHDIYDGVADAPTANDAPTPPSSMPGSARLAPFDYHHPKRGGQGQAPIQRRNSDQPPPAAPTSMYDQRPRSSSASNTSVVEVPTFVRPQYTRDPVPSTRPVLGEQRGRHVNLLSVDDSPATLKKRPSLVLTVDMDSPAFTAEMNAGLGFQFDATSHNLSSGTPTANGARSTRRVYAADSTPQPSPLLSDGSTTPLGSPAISFLPKLWSLNTSNEDSLPSSIASPMGSTSTMERRASTSPRLGALAEPIGRLASGLVRRASNANVHADELPMAQLRRDSTDSLAVSESTPSLRLSPTISVSSVVTLPRRASYASQAREKEQEKQKEIEHRDFRKRVKAAHNRAFSWAVRPGDIGFRSNDGASRSRSMRVPSTNPVVRKVVIGFVIALTLWALFPLSAVRDRISHHANRHHNRPATRARPDGKLFIHPEILRGPAPAPSKLTAPVRWVGRVLHLTSSRKHHDERDDFRNHEHEHERSHLQDHGHNTKQKHHSTFTTAPHVAYKHHKALPPPLQHSDEPQRDTLVLYRILGNDLPPRHSPGQTLRNLRFLLQYESDFSLLPPLGPHTDHHAHLYGSGSKAYSHTEEGGLRVDKYFVLNRIADAQMVTAIISLLHMYSVPDSRILLIPFEWSEYERRGFRWEGGVDKMDGWDIGASQDDHEAHAAHRSLLEEHALAHNDAFSSHEHSEHLRERRLKKNVLTKLRAIDFTYHEKNLYAMNNNGGRNFALEHGRSLPNARWILPLDGNSFLTPAAMYSIVQTLSIAGEGPQASRYLLMPMARLLSNDDVQENNTFKLVPEHHHHDRRLSAIEEAEHFSRPETAPDTPEEPQIGFRYDSTEDFQEAMRYGRRSKLELLWRLGAIPYSKGLDQRTLPWETEDRHHVTADAWASIPGAPGVNTSSPIHRPLEESGRHEDAHHPVRYESPPFVNAGWVYRLFSGYKRQEETSPEAVTLRNTNRIKGIVVFLERLDEQIARGEEGCDPDEDKAECGYHPDRYWNFDESHLEMLRNLYEQGEEHSTKTVREFERQIEHAFDYVYKHLDTPEDEKMDVHTAAQHSLMFALAGYLTSDYKYTTVASQLIMHRFINQLPHFYLEKDQHEQQLVYSGLEGEDETSFEHALAEHGSAYAFPPSPVDRGEAPKWSAQLGRRVSAHDIPRLPFDPLEFDPSMMLDAIRLLTHQDSPRDEGESLVSRDTVQPMLTAHLSWLLYSPDALQHSRRPPNAASGAAYDAKIAVLAAFLDDAKLLGRVANRARLRLPEENREHGIMFVDEEVKAVHWRLIQGLAHIRFRPYSIVMDLDDLDHGGHDGSAHGYETPMDILNVY
ncbi:BQ2448_927 [Microbotryum intermedium]|uniref:BQ2448_927 protein n=1 Tax=Microbotryum intermedium TaxID=269621 RepID=A0A238FCJ9_9BASI|nr:BQ2448_927 [Microbotryum intermedium]